MSSLIPVKMSSCSCGHVQESKPHCHCISGIEFRLRIAFETFAHYKIEQQSHENSRKLWFLRYFLHILHRAHLHKKKLFRKLQTSFVFFHFHIVRTSVSSVDILCHFVVVTYFSVKTWKTKLLSLNFFC